MKCFFFSLLLAQIAVTATSLALSMLVVIPSYSPTNAWKALTHIIPLAQLFAFLPSVAIIAVLTFSPMSDLRPYAHWGGAVVGSVLYMFIGLWPLVPGFESWPINLIPALVFNAVIGGLYGFTIGAAVKLASASKFCSDT